MLEILFWGYLIGVLVMFVFLRFLSAADYTLGEQIWLSLIWPFTVVFLIKIIEFFKELGRGGR